MHSLRLASFLSGCITSIPRTAVGQRACTGTVSQTGTSLQIRYCALAVSVCRSQRPDHYTALSDNSQRCVSAAHLQHQELCERSYSTVVALAALQKSRQQTTAQDRRLQEHDILRSRAPRKRMKLFQDLQDCDLAVADSATEHDTTAAAPLPTAEAATSITARVAAAAARELHHGSVGLAQQQDQQQEEQQQQLQQQQQHMPLGLAAGADRQQVYVFWDLDNKNPSEWLGMPELINNLKTALSKFGTVSSISAYSNINTLTWVVPGEMGGGGCDDDSGGPGEPWGLSALEEEIGENGDDALRCPLCGRRCKSIQDRNKHFRQLHEREHNKKMGSGRQKITAKYLASDKAARYRTATSEIALPRSGPSSSGKKGQLVKLLLQQYGVTLKDVPNGPQAADVMMANHIRYLASILTSQEQQQQQQQQQLDTEQQQEMAIQQQQAVKEPTTKQTAKRKQPYSVPPTARMSDAVLVVVSDDRGFREVAKYWLNNGAGVVLVAARDIESWDTPKWQMSSDDRIAFLDWYDLL